MLFNPFPNEKFFQTEGVWFANHNFKFDDNGRKFFKRVENTVGNGEIARYDYQKIYCTVHVYIDIQFYM